MPASAADLTVSDAWIRALPAKLPAAGYFTLTNTGKAEVSLTGASSVACGMLMLHKSAQSGGMGSMEDVAAVAVPAGGTIRFAPGGYHLMCMDPTPAVKPGGKIGVELTFAGGARLAADFAVKNAQGK
ncbi:MAG: copper chaperone PCu(A)C [Alphaproteobacteria bacterium]|nr:copper chaperone PCu(A)C [Alphaproteobacteria bacterium]